MWRLWYLLYRLILHGTYRLTGGSWAVHVGWLWKHGPKARRRDRDR